MYFPCFHADLNHLSVLRTVLFRCTTNDGEFQGSGLDHFPCHFDKMATGVGLFQKCCAQWITFIWTCNGSTTPGWHCSLMNTNALRGQGNDDEEESYCVTVKLIDRHTHGIIYLMIQITSLGSILADITDFHCSCLTVPNSMLIYFISNTSPGYFIISI